MGGPGRGDWRPAATFAALRRRAELAASVRQFFAARGVLEVETPLLAPSTATDPHLASIACRVGDRDPDAPLFLQTSPELAMKRLLAAGSGSIFQLGKAFRDAERGRRHHSEFTMLEWYRPGWDHHRLMDEVDELLGVTLKVEPAQRIAYDELFRRRLDVDPHRADAAELAAVAAGEGIEVGQNRLAPDEWLQLLLSQVIEPDLGYERPVFVVDFPAFQAAMARVRPGEPPVAERFEVFVRGLELANGYHELTDPVEQRRRLVADLESRRQRGLARLPLDQDFLAALEHGLPPSAGVALGFDRLVMLDLGATDIGEVMAFRHP